MGDRCICLRSEDERVHGSGRLREHLAQAIGFTRDRRHVDLCAERGQFVTLRGAPNGLGAQFVRCAGLVPRRPLGKCIEIPLSPQPKPDQTIGFRLGVYQLNAIHCLVIFAPLCEGLRS